MLEQTFTVKDAGNLNYKGILTVKCKYTKCTNRLFEERGLLAKDKFVTKSAKSYAFLFVTTTTLQLKNIDDKCNRLAVHSLDSGVITYYNGNSVILSEDNL